MELRRNSRKLERSHSPSHTSLMLACQQEAQEDVTSILERQPGAALQQDRSGKNALHYCAENVHTECASRVLSAAPALLNKPDEEGYAPLHLAVISGNKCMVKFLLTKGADPKAVDSEKHSCVHWATVSGNSECLDLLIDAGADPSTPDIHGAYPVHYASQMCGPNSEMGNDVKVGLSILQKLLSRGVDVTVTDRDGRPPLLWAASGGSSDAILALVKAASDVNATDRDGLTALHCAASRGHVECLETLITLCGAEVDKVDESGCSALFYAVTLGHADCTNLLLRFGSDGNRQDNKSRTPAHCGAAKGQLETLKILAHHKANLWLRNAKGDMPLHEAVQSGRKDLVEWLLQSHRSSVNAANANGRTPMHIAAITNNVDMCKVLMDYGAFINPIMKNSKNQHLTPLDAALHRSNRGCAKYLSLHGAMPASKLHEKREYNRYTETNLPENLELSPGTKWRILRDSSAQTEPQLRDADIPARVVQKTVSSTANLSRDSSPSRIPCPKKNIRCIGVESSGKPIIAKVYVHTKRSKSRRSTRKATGYRRDCESEKLLSNERPRPFVSFPLSELGTSNNQADTETPRETTDFEKDVPARKASQPAIFEEPFQQVPEEEMAMEETEEVERSRVTEDDQHYDDGTTEVGHRCDCYIHHDTGATACDCSCHRGDGGQQHLSVEQQRRRSSLRTDFENQSPLSSIRSFESTIKDSGFSDDVDRGHPMSSSEDERNGYSDSESKYGRRRGRHIARYVVSSGTAETFRLEEEDEERDTVAKPRSSSLPHLRKRCEHFETCPRLLNRPTITKEVQRSLKKYQMERRLFYELQELKRKQITTNSYEEREVVQRMVDRFRNHVLSPYISDFEGALTFRAFEVYLYEQLRKISMGGKIPKPKSITKERTYLGPLTGDGSERIGVLCVCGTHKCPDHHAQSHESDLENSHVPLLPEIPSKIPIRDTRFNPAMRSKSWDRLDGSPRKYPIYGSYPSKVPSSKSFQSLTNPFPRRVPAGLLAAINERLGPDVYPEDTIVVEMSAEGVSSKMRHAFTVQELEEVVTRYERELGRKVKPIALESVVDPEDEPITFEIRHGKERNVFKLPACKLKGNKKWLLHYCLWPGLLGPLQMVLLADGEPLPLVRRHSVAGDQA